MASAVDYHVAGEPFRMVTGVHPIRGATMGEKMEYAEQELDALRRLLVLEPRGHADMFGGFVTEPVREASLFGAFFFDATRFSSACGHGTIALGTAALEMGLCEREEPETRVQIDVPAGEVTALVRVADGIVRCVRYRGVDSFVVAEGITVETSVGAVEVDLAYGGVFHAFVEVGSDGRIDLAEENLGQLGSLYREIKSSIDSRWQPRHPVLPHIRDVDGVNFILREPTEDGKRFRIAPMLADGAFDRSPCGTGTSAWLALLWERGELGLGESIVQANIIGTEFRAAVIGEGDVAGARSILSEIEGNAYMTGFHQFVVDAHDPLGEGFLLRRGGG